MAECKECGGNLKKVKNKAGEIFLKCEDCGKVYKMKQEKEAEPVAKKVEPKKASNPMECKECGGTLKKVKNKAGDIFLKCTDCGKITKYKPETEVEVEEEKPVKKVAAKPVVKEEEDNEMECKVCGGDLKKVKNKAGDILLKCTECGKLFKYKPKEVIPPPEEDEDEEEEEEVIPAPVAVKEEPAPAPVEEEFAAEEEEEESVEAPVEEEEEEEEPVPAPVVEPIVLNKANEDNDTDDLASIAKSLSEINTTLKALLTIISKKN